LYRFRKYLGRAIDYSVLLIFIGNYILNVAPHPKSFPLKGRTFLTSVEALSLRGERVWDRGV
jgi:hypothetical protein